LLFSSLAAKKRLNKIRSVPSRDKKLKRAFSISPAFARARSAGVTWWLLLAGAISPAVLAFYIQKKHWINIPIWDEWDTPGNALLHYAQGALTWADLYAQHNESRKVVPRLIHIAIASVAGWDVRQGMVLTFLCVCAVSACALTYLRRRVEASPVQILFAWCLVNFLLFAPSQYENFLSGFAYEFFVPILCLFGCIAVNLSSWRFSLKVVANSALAVVATYTFAHGMLLWVFALPIPSQRDTPKRRLITGWLTYAAIGFAAIYAYLIGYSRPEVAPEPAGAGQWLQISKFIIVWLGALLRSPWVSPWLAGMIVAAVIIATTTLALSVVVRNRSAWRSYYPWLLLLGFSLASAVLTAIGRVNLGIDMVFNTWFDGFSSMRYNATNVFAYVAAIGLLFNVWGDWLQNQPRLRTGLLITFSSGCTLLAVAWTHLFSEESKRVGLFQENRRRAQAAVTWIRVLPENPEIFFTYPYPEGFWQRASEMQQLGIIKMSMADERMQAQVSALPHAADVEGGSLDIVQRESGGRFRFIGWARNPENNARADYVVLGWEDSAGSFHPFTALLTGSSRLDVVKVFNAGSLKNCGFNQEIDVTKLPAQADTIKAWAVDFARKKVFPLAGSVRLEQPASK
jgi:hypothetical protein